MHAVETVQKYGISQVLVPSEAQNTKDAVKPIKKIVKEGFSTLRAQWYTWTRDTSRSLPFIYQITSNLNRQDLPQAGISPS